MVKPSTNNKSSTVVVSLVKVVAGDPEPVEAGSSSAVDIEILAYICIWNKGLHRIMAII